MVTASDRDRHLVALSSVFQDVRTTDRYLRLIFETIPGLHFTRADANLAMLEQVQALELEAGA